MNEAEHDLYPTRGEHERLLKRSDPVVFGRGEKQSPYGLAPEEVDSYEKNGFLLLPAIMTASTSCRHSAAAPSSGTLISKPGMPRTALPTAGC